MKFTRPEYYELSDGRIWKVDSAAFLSDPNTDAGYQEYLASGGKAIHAPDKNGATTKESLRATLKFYGFDLGELATAEDIAEVKRTAAQEMSARILSTVAQKQVAQMATFTNEEYQVLADAEIFPIWEAGVTYSANERIQHNGVVYQVLQQVTAQSHQAPDASGMLAIYRPLSATTRENGDGTLSNPMNFLLGMDCHAGQHYYFNGHVYKALQDMIPCVWEPGSAGTSAVWQLTE